MDQMYLFAFLVPTSRVSIKFSIAALGVPVQMM